MACRFQCQAFCTSALRASSSFRRRLACCGVSVGFGSGAAGLSSPSSRSAACVKSTTSFSARDGDAQPKARHFSGPSGYTRRMRLSMPVAQISFGASR